MTPPRITMSRSAINASIELAKQTFSRFGIALPPFAFWTVDDWQTKGVDVDEIRQCMLGWDVTDFGSNHFEQIGRTLFTLRNGTTRFDGYPKTYAEKLLLNPEGQRAPAHYHRSKMEDICVRAGGNVMVQLTNQVDGSPLDTPVRVAIDGQMREIAGGSAIRLEPGMSVCIPPGTIHQFWGEEGTGISVSSEVSSVCDDWNDNAFLDPAERFPGIEEDEPRTHYLVHEYPAAKSS